MNYYLLLGSNVGDRVNNLKQAELLLEQKIGEVELRSSIYETAPWGKLDQAQFLNAVLVVNSKLSPDEAIAVMQEIETTLGKKTVEKWGPRTIDIDVLYIDDAVINEDHLTVPHPRMYDRNFTLIPLMEVAGDFIDPVRNISVEELYDLCEDETEVAIYDEEEE